MFSRRYLLRLVAMASLSVLAGCADSGSRSSVQGQVSYEGQPVDQGGIAFLPTEEDANSIRATGQIREGNYSLDSRRGPNPGKYRVEITWNKKTGKKVPGEGGTPKDETQQVIPPNYNTNSELVVDVKPGHNTIDFPLPLKK